MFIVNRLYMFKTITLICTVRLLTLQEPCVQLASRGKADPAEQSSESECQAATASSSNSNHMIIHIWPDIACFQGC